MQVHHHLADYKFEVSQGDAIAGLFYRQHGKAFMIMHTEVTKSMSGLGVGRQLIIAALAYAKTNNFNVIVYCPYVKSYLKKHPELKEGVRVMMAK